MKGLRSLLLAGLVIGCARQAAPASAHNRPLESSSSPVVPASGPIVGRTPPPAVAEFAFTRGARERELGVFGVRSIDGAVLTADELLGELAAAEAVCIGERPPNAMDRETELAVFAELLDRARASGRQLGLGLAALRVDQQRRLNAFASGKLELHAFDDASHWADACDDPHGFYGPLLEAARNQGAGLVALNMRSDLARKVAESGISGLNPVERRQLYRLTGVLPTEESYASAERGRTPGGQPLEATAARAAEAQLVSLDTVAETASAWLAERRPLRQLLIVASLDDCRQSEVPGRIHRRLVDSRVASAVPVLDNGERPPAAEGYDYAIVLTEDPAVAGPSEREPTRP